MGWKILLLDVENALLYGTLEEDIFMETTEGMKAEKGKCLRLKKSVYGSIQASRVWWKTFQHI